MPASDKFLRKPSTMHVVFAASSLLLLVSTIWMMAADHIDQWRDYQRKFYATEAAQLRVEVAQVDTPEYRQQLDGLQAELEQTEAELDDREKDLPELRKNVASHEQEVDIQTRIVRDLRAVRDVARANFDLGVRDRVGEEKLAQLKAEFDSQEKKVNDAELLLETKRIALDEFQTELKEKTSARDEIAARIKEQKAKRDRLHSELVTLAPETPLNKFKRKIMEWPILDGFNSHLSIRNDWLPELKITLGMARTARFDRCRTCHLGIDRTTAGEVAAFPFGEVNSDDPEEWVRAGKYPQPFATHPRTDVYLTATSPHPLATFGCTTCHEGQGSGTDFSNAAHTPNDPHEEHVWHHDYGYQSNHFWEYPMLPERFRESSCIKCHHQVIELGVNEKFGSTAPKVYQGWQLISEYGCFGCHEIRGYDGPKSVGPDLRLEPNYNEFALRLLALLDAAAPAEAGAAAQTTAGGLSLAHVRSLAEQIVRQPLNSEQPREELLKLIEQDKQASREATQGDQNGAKRVQLTSAMYAAVDGLKSQDRPGRMRKVGPSLRHITSKTTLGWIEYWTEEPKRFRPTTRMPQFFGLSNQQDPHAIHYTPVELAGIAQYLADKATPFEVDSPREDYQPDAQRGQLLFTQRGCLACHQHEKVKETGDKKLLTADFGPDLSQVHLKLKPGQEGFRWLYTWIRDPERYHPRTKMPDLFLDPQGEGEKYVDPAADIAAFLLQGEPGGYKPAEVADAVLDELVRMYLAKVLTNPQVEKTMTARRYPFGPEMIKGDEIELSVAKEQADVSDEEWRRMKLDYIGRRTISQYGCYGCHDVPGFESARPIGTTLQDWGRKDTSRLALEHIEEYLDEPKIRVLAVEFPSAEAASEAAKQVGSADAFRQLAEERRQSAESKQEVLPVQLVGGEPHAILGDTDHLFALKPETWAVHTGTKERPFLVLVEGRTESLKERVERTLKQAAAGEFPTTEESDRALAPAFFYESLQHHGRPGFIWQKLREPRSYDYLKVETKRYDERLRMPKFPLAEEEIEAIATFVLGLIAEPPGEQYLYRPAGAAAERDEGERLLQKFNCVGCHMIELPEFRYGSSADDPNLAATPQRPEEKERVELLLKLKPPRQGFRGETATFSDGDKQETLPVMSFHGITYLPPDPAEDPEFQEYAIDLWETLEVKGNVKLPGDRMLIPATRLVEQKPARGGQFAQWLATTLYASGDAETPHLGWQMSPPPLYQEGIKVQTPWLYRFLKNPEQIRHTTVLRMPRFNMSDDEARSLANYFAAFDGAEYPYQEIAQRQPQYLSSVGRRFDETFSEKEHEYLTESWHLLNAPLCIKCHAVGGRQPQVQDPKKDIRGPNLDLANDRLRPDWLLLWLYKPAWITPYTSMPAVFPPGQKNFPTVFDGDADWQSRGARDALLNYNRLMEREGKYIPPEAATTPAAGAGE